MTRSLRTGLLAIFAVLAIARVPLACQSGGVGDPCTPEDEFNGEFPGFQLQQEYIESRSFQCATRICLVNHFQGRVSCPRGQTLDSIKDCGSPGGADQGLCEAIAGAKCVASETLAPPCDPKKEADCADVDGVCDPDSRVCVCGPDTVPREGFHCVPEGNLRLQKRFVCHVPGSCQSSDPDDASNAGKPCCIPGTDTPVGAPVCGQCDKKSKRNAELAVHCSCRCGVADGAPEEPNFDFCDCPTGFTCSQIRPHLGEIGEPLLTGKYCIKEGAAFDEGAPPSCGVVEGNAEEPCEGVGRP